MKNFGMAMFDYFPGADAGGVEALVPDGLNGTGFATIPG
jgi:hypothetical protein